jgi:hypothetical protein
MRKSTKITAVLGSVALTVATAGAAYAYWTTTGGGTGSATTGTNTAVTVTQVGSVAALVPGGTAQAVDFKINNPISTPQYISTVTVAMTSVSAPLADATHPCTTSDFTLTQPNAINADLPAGVSTYSPSGSTLKLDNSASNQDGCKGATVHLSFTAA